ncbi:hypothetical protein G6W57_00605 [Streptomyces sp. CAI-121]|uniref:hypothetical protein n=1 Tax=unclassified Streptomyces TaxID=2593676 RepID=UPI001587A89F|nr:MULTISPECIES: hypothetical protein [unclassified Streptomyces]NUV65616.1 hypothetical protein [Streptomyces sp. CAI-121]NUW12353.1 hypothetical protein [Streptomyces sp. CAI-68]
MTYRPYPNADRALAQLDRHVHTVELPEWRVKLAADARRALAGAAEALEPMTRVGRFTDREWESALGGPDWQEGLKVG